MTYLHGVSRVKIINIRVLGGGLLEDGGVNGSHTDLLPGQIWNYNSMVEKPPGTNN